MHRKHKLISVSDVAQNRDLKVYVNLARMKPIMSCFVSHFVKRVIRILCSPKTYSNLLKKMHNEYPLNINAQTQIDIYLFGHRNI